MKVIHDSEFGGIMTIPLICDWGIAKICQVKGCKENTNTILVISADESPTGKSEHIGICEKHYKKSKKAEEFQFQETINL